MIIGEEAKAIKKLIMDGYDLELISFELDKSIEDIRQLKAEIEASKKANSIIKNRETREECSENTHSRLQQMRKRYNELFYNRSKTNTQKSKKPKEVVEKERKTIEKVIAEIEKVLEEMKSLSDVEKKESFKTILSSLKKIEGYQLTIGEAVRINTLMNSQEIESLKNKNKNSFSGIVYKKDPFTEKVYNVQQKSFRNIMESIDTKAAQTENLEELNILKSVITDEMVKYNPLFIRNIRDRIDNKISEINTTAVIKKLNDIPENIENIIMELVQGKLDLEKANVIIEEEARKRVQDSPKTVFALTEEKQKKQIIMQIRSALIDKPKKYRIENPELAIMQLKELYGGETVQAVQAVVKNMIGVKDFETAKEIYKKFNDHTEENEVMFRLLKKEIRNAEISDIVLKGINMETTSEKEKEWFELLEEGIEMGNIKLGAVSLGKSQDGTRNITLADIWPNQNVLGKSI